MLSKLRNRLTYANVMSSIAVFLALTGGTAVALSGTNTVFSDDIVDGEVRNPDLRAGAVTNGKLGDGAVSSGKVLDNHLTGDDVKGDSLKGADIDESSLTVGSLRGPPGPTFGSFGGSNPTSSPDFIAPASSPTLRREFTTPSAGRLLVEAHYRALSVNCPTASIVPGFTSRVSLYLDGTPVPGTERYMPDLTEADYSVTGLTTAKVDAGNHTIAMAVDCISDNSVNSISDPYGYSLGAVLLGG